VIRRGDIYFVDLDPVQGREPGGPRPVLVVSSNSINRQPLVVTVVAGTDAGRVPRDYPVNLRVSALETGLPRDTVFLCFQLRSLDPARFPDSAAGRLSEDRMSQVDSILKRVLSLP
jgi:mRNA interferase MazF